MYMESNVNEEGEDEKKTESSGCDDCIQKGETCDACLAHILALVEIKDVDSFAGDFVAQWEEQGEQEDSDLEQWVCDCGWLNYHDALNCSNCWNPNRRQVVPCNECGWYLTPAGNCPNTNCTGDERGLNDLNNGGASHTPPLESDVTDFLKKGCKVDPKNTKSVCTICLENEFNCTEGRKQEVKGGDMKGNEEGKGENEPNSLVSGLCSCKLVVCVTCITEHFKYSLSCPICKNELLPPPRVNVRSPPVVS
jgi:hypothetical protein